MDMVRMAALFHFLLNSESLRSLRAIITQIHIPDKFTNLHFLILSLEVPTEGMRDLQQDHLHLLLPGRHPGLRKIIA